MWSIKSSICSTRGLYQAFRSKGKSVFHHFQHLIALTCTVHVSLALIPRSRDLAIVPIDDRLTRPITLPLAAHVRAG